MLRRTAIASFGVVICLVSNVSLSDTPSEPDWVKVGAAASKIVDHESPDNAFPFDLSLPRTASKSVFVHYFTPFPPSPDNKPSTSDYWSNDALQPSGLQGRYLSVGGMVRERPLPLLPWTTASWREYNFAVDILRARRMGADGFIVALFGLPPSPLWTEARRLCDTASHVAPDFEIIPQLDADALPNASAEDMVTALRDLAGCKSLKRDKEGRLTATVFDPKRRPPAFWQQILSIAGTQGLHIALTPIFLNPAASAGQYDWGYGMSFWGAADPASVSGPSSGEAVLRNVIRHWATNWMAPVRPQDFRPKSAMVLEAANTSLYRALWNYAILHNATAVHVITWNDYTESTETEPSTKSQFLWYDLTRYYIGWFKTGHAPRILQDALYFSHRGQIFQPNDPPGVNQRKFQTMGLTPIRNDIEMLALLKSPARLEIQTGSHVCWENANAGMAVLTCPAQVGTPKFRLSRNQQTIVEMSSNFTIESSSTREDGLYYGGSSSRAYVP